MPGAMTDPDAAAERYETTLRGWFGGGRPAFDLLLPGLGEGWAHGLAFPANQRSVGATPVGGGHSGADSSDGASDLNLSSPQPSKDLLQHPSQRASPVWRGPPEQVPG